MKTTVNIVSGEEKDGKNGKYYIYKDENSIVMLSKEKLAEGVQEVFMTEKESEYKGTKQVSRWITKEEYKPKAKDGKTFFPKQPDKVAIVKESMVLAAEWINLKIKPAPKTKDELTALIKEAQEVIKGLVG